MSVILSACRNSRKKAIERALKKKVDRQREKRQAALTEVVDQLRLPEDTPSVKIWTFLLNNAPNSVVLHLDTLDVIHNGTEVETQNEFTDGGSKINFFLGEYVAQIVTEVDFTGRKRLVYILAIDGSVVPE